MRAGVHRHRSRAVADERSIVVLCAREAARLARGLLSVPVVSVGLVLGVTVMIYAPALSHQFVYEDLNDPTTFLQPWSWGLTTRLPFRSMTSWTNTFSLWVGSGAAWPYHAMGIVLHLWNVLLMALLAGPLAAAVFAWHPLQVETVAYVSARADLLAATCVVLALWCARRGWWIAALVGCAAATLSKESAIVAWVLVPFAAWWFRWRVPAWVPAALFAAMFLTAWAVLSRLCWACDDLGRWPVSLSIGHTVHAAAVIVRYAAWTALPVGLSILHDWSWLTVPAAVGLVSTAAMATWMLRATPVLFAVLWIALALAPRLLVPYGDGLHDHHWYLPMIGICLALGAWRKEL